MKGSWTIDLIWWITAVELPAMASLFWMIWRNRQDFDNEISDLREHTEISFSNARENLSAYKLEVAKNYASIAYMKDVERRLTGHLVRIENKLDQTPRERN
ncbi:hypothetical protein RYZ26_19180 [Terasakiella sp. A23]|uniref:hypothetical protein n=1 Tax=Terasakiella sp. FCG-A23 TaxID=3080561 RepID=UPI002952E827|nr:hypothetical protein [Terasakiella sp. A23]MDV7341733.1 hypothetical protein [Terasakiella sp. A23]